MVAAGFDTTRSIHALGAAAPDERVLAHAVAEERIRLTCDSDFGELVFLNGHRAPPGIIYVRFEPQDVADIIPRLLAVLTEDFPFHHMVVIGDSGDRSTPFPKQVS